MPASRHLLCLHGLYQNANVFAGKCDILRSTLAGTVEFHFIDGPLTRIPGVLRGGAGSSKGLRKKTLTPAELEQFRSWFHHLDRNHPLTSPLASGSDQSHADFELFQQSLQLLKSVVHSEHTFSGVLGFSQGAALASLLCTKEVSEFLEWKPEVAILCSGYQHPCDHNLLKDVKSLHLYGKNDHVVSPQKSKELSQLFASETEGETAVHLHTQGHVIPTQQESCDIIRGFLERS